MSGGVDSSVAAWLLREQGHDVIGLFMRHGAAKTECHVDELRARKQGCCSATDATDARRVAEILGIPFFALNFEREFERIIDYFVAEYSAGRTPNPCVVCNTWLKFGKLFDYADSVGAEFVATGHYARLEQLADGQVALRRGVDESKDQSYVLFGIERARLPRMILPIGAFEKEAIRKIAADLGLNVAEKPDSQEICFVPDQDHARFVREHRPPTDTSGEIVTTEGEVVGRHAGIEGFTIGQRKGFGVGLGERRYVVEIRPQQRQVVVGTRDALSRQTLTAEKVNWLIAPPCQPLACTVKIRYRSTAARAVVTPLPSDRIVVAFADPVQGIAPGQAAVCYEGDRVLGGGWIE